MILSGYPTCIPAMMLGPDPGEGEAAAVEGGAARPERHGQLGVQGLGPAGRVVPGVPSQLPSRYADIVDIVDITGIVDIEIIVDILDT